MNHFKDLSRSMYLKWQSCSWLTQSAWYNLDHILSFRLSAE
ncbi:hypothetical protein [Vibrio sp. SCSIO 43136]|nr:hypothetical protein [Vibrio sp. SCSIO 43136]